jgi:hypothetical protein
MAEEGNKNEGQESDDAAMDAVWENVNAELQMAPPPPPESYGDWRTAGKATQGWLEAIAKDERSQKIQAHARMQARNPSAPRSWQSRRAEYRARVDWNRTEQGWQRKMRAYWEPRHPDAPYAKGTSDSGIRQWWDKLSTALWNVLGIS